MTKKISKILLCALSAVLINLALSACGDFKDIDPTADEWGLALAATEVSESGMTLVFIQSGGSPSGVLKSGEYYSLEIKKDGKWEEYPIQSNVLIDLNAFRIPLESSVEKRINFEIIYGKLPKGDYRIKKSIDNSFKEKYYYAEFKIK